MELLNKVVAAAAAVVVVVVTDFVVKTHLLTVVTWLVVRVHPLFLSIIQVCSIRVELCDAAKEHVYCFKFCFAMDHCQIWLWGRF